MQKKLMEFNLSQRNKKIPELRAGDVVKISRKIKEGKKERTQVFEGIIIAINGRQSSSPMITVRKVSYGVGVELILPVYSPVIEKIELVKRAKIRRAKLYYIREKSAKSLRLKYKDLSNFTKIEEETSGSEKNEGAEESISAEEKITEGHSEKKSEPKNKKEEKTNPKTEVKKDSSEKSRNDK